MRTFVIFPKDRAEKVEASTKLVAVKRYMKIHPDEKISNIACCLESMVTMGVINNQETTEVKEQGVVITELPKRISGLDVDLSIKACDPEDSKPEHKEA